MNTILFRHRSFEGAVGLGYGGCPLPVKKTLELGHNPLFCAFAPFKGSLSLYSGVTWHRDECDVRAAGYTTGQLADVAV